MFRDIASPHPAVWRKMSWKVYNLRSCWGALKKGHPFWLQLLQGRGVGKFRMGHLGCFIFFMEKIEI
jgi:hypothetical protein